MAEEAMTDLKGPSSVALIAIWGCTAVFPKCFPASYNTSISVRCLLAELMALAGNSIPDEVGDKAGVGEGGLGDGGGVVLLQPGRDGCSLIGALIPCYHWLYHNFLQSQKRQHKGKNTQSPCLNPCVGSVQRALSPKAAKHGLPVNLPMAFNAPNPEGYWPE